MDKDKEYFLSRQEAIETLRELSNSGVLSKELEENLDEIANLISYELDGEHFWGQPYKLADKLRIDYREDLWTDELMQEASKQHLNARFIPCKNEIESLKEYYYEMRGASDEESDFAYRQECEKDFIYNYGLYNAN
jgi:hypothetical protein